MSKAKAQLIICTIFAVLLLPIIIAFMYGMYCVHVHLMIAAFIAIVFTIIVAKFSVPFLRRFSDRF